MTEKRMTLRMIFGAIVMLAPLNGDGPTSNEPRMLDLNVVAVDSHGQAVTDLTRDELRITDSGKPQTITFFRHRDSGLAQAPKLGPNEFSNRNGSNVPRATLILFDLLNERFGTRGTTADQLVHDLGSLEQADYVYLYMLTLDGRLYPVHGLPDAEGEASPPGGVPWTRQIKPLLDQGLRTVLQVRPVDIDEAVRVQITLRALDGIASELSRVPGHKSIVWLTDGIPIELGPRRSDIGDWVDFTPLLRQMSEAFDRSGVAIYPVRQVMLGSPQNVDGASRDGMSSIETLDLLAGMTGGRPDAGKDVGAAIRQSIIDMRTSYQVGYYPPEKNWDDKFHKIRVTCTRKGVRIQAKTGYYAWRDTPGEKTEQAINSAVSTRFDAAEIGLRSTLARNPDGKSLHLDAHIDAHDVVLVHQGDLYDGQLRLAIVGYGPGQLVQRGPVTPLDVHYSVQDRDKALQQGIGFVQDVGLTENTTSLRLIVFDRGSNAIGSVTMPVPARGKGD
jgi:VWFA-related protein